MATAKKTARNRRVPVKAAGRAPGGNGATVLPVDDLIAHQDALERLARGLEAIGLREQAAQLRAEIARLRSALLDSLVSLLGDRESKFRDAATRTLRELLVKDPSIAADLIRARDAATDPEIRDRLNRRILIADPSIYETQIDDILADAQPLFAFLILPSPQDAEFARVLEELKQDHLEAREDAEAAKSDTNEESIRERFRRYRRREERRKARQPYFDELRRKLFGG
jgi:hypothetical protein